MFNNHIPDNSGNNKTHKVSDTLAKAKSYIIAHKKGTVAVGIAILLGLSGIGIAFASGAFHSEPAKQVAKNEVIEENFETAHINITADKGWTKDSTPAIVHVKGSDDDNKDIDFFHAVAPTEDNMGSYEVELEPGKYSVKVISPVNADGSAYELFETGEAQTLEVIDLDEKKDDIDAVPSTVGADDAEIALINADIPNTIDMTMKHIPADKVTDEMLTQVVKDTKDAIAKGDETLKGDAGKAVLEVLDKNIEANPNADKAKDESDKAQDDAKLDEAPVETPADKPADNGNADNSNASAQNDNAPASKPSNNGNGNSNSSSNQSASKPADKPSQPAKPAHSHSWKNHTATKQVWVSNWVEEPVYETQKVKVGQTYICNCGFTATGILAMNDHCAQHLINGEPDNYQAVPRYEQQTVQVGTNKVDKGHYETQSYTDYQYCDCGATK